MTAQDFLKIRFQEASIVKPLLIHHKTIDVIMQDLDLLIVLRIEDECPAWLRQFAKQLRHRIQVITLDPDTVPIRTLQLQ